MRDDDKLNIRGEKSLVSKVCEGIALAGAIGLLFGAIIPGCKENWKYRHNNFTPYESQTNTYNENKLR